MTNEAPPKCGIVMPISPLDGCDEAHWVEVRAIVSDAISDAGFEPNVVSDADDVGIIQKRIIENLYENPVVVCDVSGKNPNVMFELGLRLAFDKPTIIIKDTSTSYSFDTSPIEHLSYPRDLRFSSIVQFKERLADKIKSTRMRATTDPAYTTFLKNFGEFTVAKIDKREVSGQEFIIEELKALRATVSNISRATPRGARPGGPPEFLHGPSFTDVCVRGRSEKAIERAKLLAEAMPGVRTVTVTTLSPDHKHILVHLENDDVDRDDIQKLIRTEVGPPDITAKTH